MAMRASIRERARLSGQERIPLTEGDVRIGVACYIESGRIPELLLVTIGGTDHWQHEFPKWESF